MAGVHARVGNHISSQKGERERERKRERKKVQDIFVMSVSPTLWITNNLQQLFSITQGG
jgi:hypothetical protein